MEGEGAVDVNREMRTPTCSAKPSFPAGFFVQTWPGGSWLVGGSQASKLAAYSLSYRYGQTMARGPYAAR